MKEVMAIIRRNKLLDTEAGLIKLGTLGFTTISVEGRGRQKGKEQIPSARTPSEVRISRTKGFVPKIMLSIIVNDIEVEKVVNKIIDINHTGRSGDGKIFVCQIDESLRVRTGEHGAASLL
jgi:nitrogen regulatory protein PII 2